MARLSVPFQEHEDLREGLTAGQLGTFKESINKILRDKKLIYEQKRDSLAAIAVSALPYSQLSDEAVELIEAGVICLLGEGAAPYHPRYVAPDYAKLLQYGSAFLDLKPAQTLFDAVNSLLTAYKYIPCAGLPVFIGRLDELFEPYLHTVSPETARQVLSSYWLLVDRLNPSAFVHANLGPLETETGNLMLELDRELKTITNLTLRYDPARTSESFALKAVRNALENTKPYFLNHTMMAADWGGDYAIASCYNGMLLGGGIFTLVRVNLDKTAGLSDGTSDDLLQRVIPNVAKYWLEIVESRTRSIVEDIRWFDNNFWVDEGYLHKEKFSSYAAIFGLAEGVNQIMRRSGDPNARFGWDPNANLLGKEITDRFHEILKATPIAYCEGTGSRACYHAQVGITSDLNTTPAVRVPSSQEPDLYSHLRAEAPSHEFLSGGVSTILEFDQTAIQNPSAVLDVIKGAFKEGIRNLSIGSVNSEFVRVTGYLIRRADLDAYNHEKAQRYSSAPLGGGVMQNSPNHLHRVTRKV